MQITIKNNCLKLTVDTLGAQMMHLQNAAGLEYLWQGDEKYWKRRAPVLFPFIGRLTENRYRLGENIYPMGIHGFAASSEFAPVRTEEDILVLVLHSNAETLAQYPFPFTFEITYKLRENTIEISYCVQNHGQDRMPFAVGGHPGFRVPLEPGLTFEDYRLVFSQTCEPDRIGFTPSVYISGHDTRYPLQDNKIIPLHHNLFDEDAIILKNMSREITLCGEGAQHAITVCYPDMPYLGIWHMPQTDAPYVCIEPWTSLPARQDVIEDLSCKSDMIQLSPGENYQNTWSITIY